MISTISSAGNCEGIEGLSGRPYTTAEMVRIDRLVAQRRLSPFPCRCGKRHLSVTAEGRDAMRLDALANALPTTA